MEIKKFTSKQDVAKGFSNYLSTFIGNKEAVHIALSGGSTPKVVFDELASNFKSKINWNNVHLYWGDERCVAPSDNESNYKMTLEHLISKINIPSENIHRIKGENNPEDEAQRYSKVLEDSLDKNNEIPKFDLVVLGMGDDGHTASIFPYQIDLWDAPKHCVVATHPDSGQKRVSITGQIINAADTVAFLVTGDNKKDKVFEIIKEKGAYKSYPATLVKPSSENLIWFMDDAAGSKID